MFEVREVPRRDDLAAGVLLGRAFVDDPVWRMIGPGWRAHRMVVSIAFHIGEVLMARRRGALILGGYEDGRLVGAAVAFPRGEEPLPWLYWVTRTIAFVLAGRPFPGLRALRLENQLDAAHPKEPHVHYWLVGADPETRGVGAVLTRAVAEYADELGRPSYLEATAPHLVSLYRLVGWEPTGTITMKTGDRIGLMWRPVRAGRADGARPAAPASGVRAA